MEIHSITGLASEIRKISNKKSNFTLKGTTKRKTTKIPTWVEERKYVIKIRAEINKTESEEIQNINIIKSWFFEKTNKIDKSFTRLIKKKERGFK